jgi:arginine utilization protein RocB
MSSIYAPEIVLKVESQEIVPQQRKLKAVWSVEAAQDLRAMYNIDAAEELSKIMAQEIANEIDKEILEDLARNAREAAEEEFRFKNRKKKILPRSINDDWQVSRFD